MCTRICCILFLFFSFHCLQAQSFTDADPVFSGVSSYKLVDAKQQKTVEANLRDKPLSLFVFLSPECPLCQNYAKTLNQLQEKYKQQLNVYGVVPGSAYTVKDVNAFEREYNIGFNLYIDTKQKLTHYLKATVTPQAILLNSKGALLYTGAIDDWVVSLGKKKLQVSEHYVQQAIEQSLLPAIVKIKKTNAVGCKINDY